MTEPVRPGVAPANDAESPEVPASEMIMYGAGWCPDVMMARRYLARHGVDYVYRDIDRDPDAMPALLALRGKAWVVPTIVMPDGTVLDNPSIRQLADLLGRPRRKG